MKKILSIALSILGLNTLTSCEEWGSDYIVDWSPVNIILEVQDKDGNTLLDPASPSNIIKGTTISYCGNTYEADTTEYHNMTHAILYTDTRAILPFFHGFYLTRKAWLGYAEDDLVLCLGEIDGAANMDEDIVITWPDGSKNTIHYHCSDHKEGKHPKCNRWYMLDGVKQNSNTFTFSK